MQCHEGMHPKWRGRKKFVKAYAASKLRARKDRRDRRNRLRQEDGGPQREIEQSSGFASIDFNVQEPYGYDMADSRTIPEREYQSFIIAGGT